MLTVIKNKLFTLFQDKDKKELIFGSSISFGLNMGSVLLGFAFLYMVSRFYGVDGTGLFSIGQSFIVLASTIAILGLNMASIRFIGQFKFDRQRISTLYRYSLLSLTFVSVILSMFLFFGAEYIATEIFKDSRLSLVIQASAITIPFCTIKNYHSDFLKGFKRIAEGELIKKFLFLLLSCILILIAFYAGYDSIHIPIIVYGISMVAVALISFFILYKKYLAYNKTTKQEKYAGDFDYKKLIYTSLPMMVTVMALMIMWNIDKLMVGYFIDTPSAGIYNVAFSAAITLNFVIKSVNSILAPKISKKFWEKDMESLQKSITFGTQMIFYVTLPLFLILVIFGKPILALFGQEFIVGYSTLLVLCIGQIINAFSGSTGFFLNMTGNQKIFQKIILSTLILNIILNIIFIPIFGILGAALATAISLSIWNIISIVYIKKKYSIITYYLGIHKK